jgi:hypothetical protein
LRPGEKLYEGPLADAEKSLPTPHPKLRVAQARVPENGKLLNEVVEWLTNPGDQAAGRVREKLRSWVPEYLGGVRPESAAAQTRPRAQAQPLRQGAATPALPPRH